MEGRGRRSDEMGGEGGRLRRKDYTIHTCIHVIEYRVQVYMYVANSSPADREYFTQCGSSPDGEELPVDP